MFIEVLFTISRTWKQPKCQSTDEWKEDVIYIYYICTHTVEYYSAIKINEIISFTATCIDLEIII